jgi:hypothetical protein
MQGFPGSQKSGGIHQQGFASGLSCKLIRGVIKFSFKSKMDKVKLGESRIFTSLSRPDWLWGPPNFLCLIGVTRKIF